MTRPRQPTHRPGCDMPPPTESRVGGWRITRCPDCGAVGLRKDNPMTEHDYHVNVEFQLDARHWLGVLTCSCGGARPIVVSLDATPNDPIAAAPPHEGTGPLPAWVQALVDATPMTSQPKDTP